MKFCGNSLSEQELREELRLQQENNTRNWAQALQLLAQVQRNQTEQSRSTEQELREELRLQQENNTRNWAQGTDWGNWDGLGGNWDRVGGTGRDPGYTGLHWVILGYTGSYWALPFPAWQVLAQVQQNQRELSRITDLMCQTIEDSRKCPLGWQFYVDSCYFFSTHYRSWDNARGFCRGFSADLVVVSNEDEQLFLTRSIQGKNNTYWIGVMDKQHKGKWTWVTGKSPTFGFWDVWEEDPNKNLKGCGAMKPNGRWTNERCSKSSLWICEKSWKCNFSPVFTELFPPDE
uniref:C-type lectin domain-containing protein n=1 Tax=Cyanoderma ruficeps TaxID=181631 RepID=A0A8C3P4C4_9PASS